MIGTTLIEEERIGDRGEFVRKVEKLQQDLDKIGRKIETPSSRFDTVRSMFIFGKLLREIAATVESRIDSVVDDRHAAETLRKYLADAQTHTSRATSDEYDFENIKARLHMATLLTGFVLQYLAQSIESAAESGARA